MLCFEATRFAARFSATRQRSDRYDTPASKRLIILLLVR